MYLRNLSANKADSIWQPVVTVRFLTGQYWISPLLDSILEREGGVRIPLKNTLDDANARKGIDIELMNWTRLTSADP